MVANGIRIEIFLFLFSQKIFGLDGCSKINRYIINSGGETRYCDINILYLKSAKQS